MAITTLLEVVSGLLVYKVSSGMTLTIGSGALIINLKAGTVIHNTTNNTLVISTAENLKVAAACATISEFFQLGARGATKKTSPSDVIHGTRYRTANGIVFAILPQTMVEPGCWWSVHVDGGLTILRTAGAMSGMVVSVDVKELRVNVEVDADVSYSGILLREEVATDAETTGEPLS
ncbi:hypothetical protein B0A49_13374 [Cryomyces minteri]|uniref:Uncharacterized protein n=1 Tax=Cryomyces minteri TaxID=331657 RepID=A0A4U0VMV2_9PEZI|nr:hypothetical protein B0A49_13900 [Cryomyces minteri]TKA54385.1 hypothetical protein B0A49_13374 [Cryomyces minteri]